MYFLHLQKCACTCTCTCTCKHNHLNFAENFPPTLVGSDTFQVDLNRQSAYTFNATDEGNFTVTISGDLPSNSSLENIGSLYTFTWTLREIVNRTLTFLATDSLSAVSMLQPQLLICACENNGTCTTNGLLSTDQNPLIMNCECQPGTSTYSMPYTHTKHTHTHSHTTYNGILIRVAIT